MMGSRHDEEPLLPASLADRLREETRELHRAAERSRFVQALLRGELEPRAYALMLRSLHGLYAALESGLARHAGDPRLAAFAEPALWRREAIERDLQALAGPSWRETLRPAAAAARYVARLDALAAAQPLRLAGHAYVRYLGDLSGGQVLARVVARSVGRDDGGATAFYDFGGAVAAARSAQALRRGLDRLGADADSADAVVEEACTAFALHGELFDELAVHAGLAAAPAGAA